MKRHDAPIVILSGAKDLSALPPLVAWGSRCFAALSMTKGALCVTEGT